MGHRERETVPVGEEVRVFPPVAIPPPPPPPVIFIKY